MISPSKSLSLKIPVTLDVYENIGITLSGMSTTDDKDDLFLFHWDALSLHNQRLVTSFRVPGMLPYLLAPQTKHPFLHSSNKWI